MSKVCGRYSGCPFAPDQTTGGCPCAELCPGFCKDSRVIASTSTEPYAEAALPETEKMSYCKTCWNQGSDVCRGCEMVDGKPTGLVSDETVENSPVMTLLPAEPKEPAMRTISAVSYCETCYNHFTDVCRECETVDGVPSRHVPIVQNGIVMPFVIGYHGKVVVMDGRNYPKEYFCKDCAKKGSAKCAECCDRNGRPSLFDKYEEPTEAADIREDCINSWTYQNVGGPEWQCRIHGWNRVCTDCPDYVPKQNAPEIDVAYQEDLRCLNRESNGHTVEGANGAENPLFAWTVKTRRGI